MRHVVIIFLILAYVVEDVHPALTGAAPYSSCMQLEYPYNAQYCLDCCWHPRDEAHQSCTEYRA